MESEQLNDEDDRVSVMPFKEIVSVLLPAHRRCSDHLLNLTATTETLKGINSNENIKLLNNDVMGKCYGVWALSRSPKNYEVILKILNVALKRPVATRWNSLFDSLKQLVELKDKLEIVASELHIADPLTINDFKFLEEYVKCNAPIAECLNKLHGAKNVTYGHLLPSLISTRNKLQKLNEVSFDYCKALIKILIASLEKGFENVFNVREEGVSAAIAAAVHPHFRLRWLHCLEKTAQERVLTAVKAGLTSCYQPPTQASVVEPMDISCDGYDFDDGSSNSIILEIPIGIHPVEEEFKRFCNDKNNELRVLHVYPIVKATFLKYNTVLSSSAAVERMFSNATMWNASRFNRLSHDHFQQRVLLKANTPDFANQCGTMSKSLRKKKE